MATKKPKQVVAGEVRQASLPNRSDAELEETRVHPQKTICQAKRPDAALCRSIKKLQRLVEKLRSMNGKPEGRNVVLQSINRELTTLNRQFQINLERHAKAREDLGNLIAWSDMAILFVDRDMRILHYTPRVADIFNLTAADIGRPLQQISSKLDQTNLAEEAAQVLVTSQPIERDVHSRDGRSYILRVYPYLTGEDRGGAALTFFDITIRRAAEETLRIAQEGHQAALECQVHERTAELKASRDLLQATMDASLDMIQVFSSVRNERGEIIDFKWALNNHSSESKWGEVRGQSLLERNPGVVEEGIFDAFRQVIETGEPHQAVRHYAHEQFDGWFLQSVVKLGDGVATTTKDITDWKMAHEEVLRLRDEIAQSRLRESEQRLHLAMDATGMGAFFWDIEHDRSEADARTMALLDLPPSDPTPWNEVLSRRIHPEDSVTYAEAVRRSLMPQSAGKLRQEVRLLLPEGTVRWLAVMGRTFFSGDPPQATHMIGTVLDITERKQTEDELQKNNERLRKIVGQTATGLVETDAEGRMTLVNSRFCDMLGFAESELLGRSVIEITAPDSVAETVEAVQRLAAGGTDFVIKKRYQRKDGSFLWAESSVSALHGTDGSFQGLVAIVIDISDRKLAEEKVRHASLHDVLTNLPNRAMLFEYAAHQLSHNRRNQRSAALLFLDLDRFKPINDTHGHGTGDMVLKETARRLSSSLRSEDLVVRLGGDEFVVLLQDIGDPRYAAEVARHIITRIGEPYPVGELTLSLSISIGIAIFPRDGDSIDDLISHADLAMYQAKQNGRNNYQFFSSDYAAIAQMHAAIEQQLKSAIRCDRFHLFYQPIVDLSNREVVSVEALLRWRDSDIGPERFIPVAEATGMINPIGRWLLREASRQYRCWMEAGLPSIPISINVSVVEFRDPDFAARLRRVLEEEGLDPSALQLEVTETAVMENIEHTIGVLTELKNSGIKILLDDFGTGYSSLAYLARLPLNKIKIDRSFVCPAADDIASRSITNAMIALGRTLELEVVAEGVESESMFEFVRAQGCSQAQGFLLGRPMSGDNFKEWYLSGIHHH